MKLKLVTVRAYFAAAALFIAACATGEPLPGNDGKGGDDGEGGVAGGGPDGECVKVGNTYKQIPGGRGAGGDCNSCWCDKSGYLVCTLIYCPPKNPTCEYHGKTYDPGNTFPSADGCNSCSCGTVGNAVCTEKACLPSEPRRCLPTGCSGQICSDEVVVTTCEARPNYACYGEATCVRQDNGHCGFTPTVELAACLERYNQ